MTKKAKLARIKDLVSKVASADGIVQTSIPFFTIIKSGQPTTLRQGVLKPSVCVVIQGNKKLLIDDKVFEYGIGDFVVSVIDLPTAGQIVKVNPKMPYYGLAFALDVQEVASIVVEAGIDLNTKGAGAQGAVVGTMDEALLDCVWRMAELLEAPQDARFLAANLRREIIYRLLVSPYGRSFYKNIVTSYQDQGIGRAINWLKTNFDQDLVIKDLAKVANMSVSSLHHRFKHFTTMGPLQFQKQLRLQEARRLMLAGSHDAGSAAFEVGYESPSQFSREYRRLFGESPAQDIKSLRLKQGIEGVQN